MVNIYLCLGAFNAKVIYDVNVQFTQFEAIDKNPLRNLENVSNERSYDCS